MKLYLARHGRTLYNTQKRFLGQIDDPLDSVGLQQAEALADRLSEELITAVISSDLGRALETASAIAQKHSLQVRTDTNLREISMGTWEGRPQDEVRGSEPTLFARWLEDPTRYYPSGGESLDAMRGRIVQALTRWQEEYPTPRDGGDEPTLVWVTHTAYLGVLLCHLLGLPLSARRNFSAENASLSLVHLVDTQNGVQPVLCCLNDTSHLKARGIWKASHSYLYLPKW